VTVSIGGATPQVSISLGNSLNSAVSISQVMEIPQKQPVYHFKKKKVCPLCVLFVFSYLGSLKVLCLGLQACGFIRFGTLLATL
jgi:hypothetical protein